MTVAGAGMFIIEAFTPGQTLNVWTTDLRLEDGTRVGPWSKLLIYSLVAP